MLQKLALLPEVKVFTALAETTQVSRALQSSRSRPPWPGIPVALLPCHATDTRPCAQLNDRLIENVIKFLGDHLRTKGTRGAEDQNILNAILVALVDGQMMEDKMINAISSLLGVRWHAVKSAMLRRIKLDDEETAGTEKGAGGTTWTRIPRSERCDKYTLQGFYLFQHDEKYFRFSSRKSEPMREHIGLRKHSGWLMTTAPARYCPGLGLSLPPNGTGRSCPCPSNTLEHVTRRRHDSARILRHDSARIPHPSPPRHPLPPYLLYFLTSVLTYF